LSFGVTSSHSHGSLLKVTRPNLHAQRRATLDPVPILRPARQIPRVDLHAQRIARQTLLAQLCSELLATLNDPGAHVRLRRHRQNDNLRR
jgi:hypothetical protein